MIDKNKLYKSIAVLAGICIMVALLAHARRSGSMTLSDYQALHPEPAESSEETLPDASGEDQVKASNPPESASDRQGTEILQNNTPGQNDTLLTGEALNADFMEKEGKRMTYAEGFYYEPLSNNLRRYITGVSFPSDEADAQGISLDELMYVHLMHYDFEGNPAEGELICNRLIAQDIVEIFYELYKNEYSIEKIRLIDEYDGDDTASMEDNNTSCFNYRNVEGSTSLSKHALGLAIDVNPLYNPYVTYNRDGTENIAPVSASAYADRQSAFPYKIDESDLCYKLFVQHGFIWGGNWNSCKDYQHFQKTIQ